MLGTGEPLTFKGVFRLLGDNTWTYTVSQVGEAGDGFKAIEVIYQRQ